MAELCKFTKGQVIFNEGDLQMFMYSIKKGKVNIFASYGKPEEKLLTTLEDGTYFGEMGLFDALPRSATAVAAEDTEAEKYTADNFVASVSDDTAFMMSILKHMTTRLRDLSRDYIDACVTIGEYVDEESLGAKKEGILAKIKRLLSVQETLQSMGVDPEDIDMMSFYYNNPYYWY